MSTTTTAPAVSPEFAAGVREFYLHQLRMEIPTTIKVIQAIPEGKINWRPDDKARTALDLAWHIATVDVLFADEIAALDFGKMMDEEQRLAKQCPKTPNEIAAWYQEHYPKSLDKLAKMTPQQLLTPLNFLGMMTLPAFSYLAFIQNHSVHHRGQLSAYLRPMGGKVPSIYGPSADAEM